MAEFKDIFLAQHKIYFSANCTNIKTVYILDLLCREFALCITTTGYQSQKIGT